MRFLSPVTCNAKTGSQFLSFQNCKVCFSTLHYFTRWVFRSGFPTSHETQLEACSSPIVTGPTPSLHLGLLVLTGHSIAPCLKWPTNHSLSSDPALPFSSEHLSGPDFVLCVFLLFLCLLCSSMRVKLYEDRNFIDLALICSYVANIVLLITCY